MNDMKAIKQTHSINLMVCTQRSPQCTKKEKKHLGAGKILVVSFCTKRQDLKQEQQVRLSLEPITYQITSDI